MYSFTRIQMYKLFSGYNELVQEYVEMYGYDEKSAKVAAVLAILEGLDAEQFLYSINELPGAASQVLDFVERLPGS